MRTNKLTLSILSLIAASSLYTTQAMAESGLTANVGATSNYLWRGFEQTNGDAAIFGGIDYSADSGFYAGTWISNADWAPGMTYEMDLYGGFAGEFSGGIGYDFGFIYYGYPDETSGDADFSEVYANFSFDALSVGIAVLTHGEGADAGDTIYASADYEVIVGNETSLAFHIGSYSGDWLAEDSIDYGVSLSKNGFTLGVSDTDVNGDDIKFYASYTIDLEL